MSSDLKVLQVIPKLGHGGAETGCYDVAHYLPENNCKSFIVTSGGELIKFILISPTPIFPGVREGYMCQEEWFRPSWRISSLCFSKVSKSDWVASNNVVIWKFKRFLKANPEVLYIDAFSLLCQDSYCKNHDLLSLMYKDNNHLNSYGAMKLKKTIEDFISSN